MSSYRTAGEPDLGSVRAEFPGWDCWQAASGRYCARRRDGTGELLDGEDANDLRDELIRVLWADDPEAAEALASAGARLPGTPAARRIGEFLSDPGSGYERGRPGRIGRF